MFLHQKKKSGQYGKITGGNPTWCGQNPLRIPGRSVSAVEVLNASPNLGFK